jgi:hypothetical protein
VHLIRLLLPLYDNDGNRLPHELLDQVFDELTHRFGGVTAYQRSPAEGAWKPSGAGIVHDDMVLFEVMVEPLDRAWWNDYRRTLEGRFAQEKLLFLALAVETL